MWYILGLFAAYMAGIFTLGLFRYYWSDSDDECRLCRYNYKMVIRGLEDQIHGLKSTQGKLGSKLNAMAFRNSGFNAR